MCTHSFSSESFSNSAYLTLLLSLCFLLGFSAYVGFIHVECVHTHPVLVVFLRMLLIMQKYKTLKHDGKQKNANSMENGKLIKLYCQCTQSVGSLYAVNIQIYINMKGNGRMLILWKMVS